MKYKVITDKDGFIQSVEKSDEGMELKLDQDMIMNLDCYKLVEGKIVMDSEKYEQKKADKQKSDRIAEIMNELDDTDYVQDEFINSLLSLNNPVTFIADMISLMNGVMKDYPNIIAKRKSLIAELKTLI